MTARIDHPGTLEIIVSFPDTWILAGCFRQQNSYYENVRLYVASLPPSHEPPRIDHFGGLSPEINRTLTTHRYYQLFEPKPQPIFSMTCDKSSGVGQVLMGGQFRLQIQSILIYCGG